MCHSVLGGFTIYVFSTSDVSSLVRADGDRIGVREGIAIKRSSCDGKTKDSTTEIDPEKNFSKNGEKLEQSERAGEDSWLDEERVTG
jgi:hypothetical protein